MKGKHFLKLLMSTIRKKSFYSALEYFWASNKKNSTTECSCFSCIEEWCAIWVPTNMMSLLITWELSTKYFSKEAEASRNRCIPF